MPIRYIPLLFAFTLIVMANSYVFFTVSNLKFFLFMIALSLYMAFVRIRPINIYPLLLPSLIGLVGVYRFGVYYNTHYELAMSIALILLVALIASNITSSKQVMIYVTLLAIIAIISSVSAFAIYIFDLPQPVGIYPSGTFGNANYLASFLALIIPVLAMNIRQNIKLYSVAIVLAISTIVLTSARAAFLVAIASIALIVFWKLSGKYKLILPILSTAILGIVALLFNDKWYALLSIHGHCHKLTGWRIAIESIKQKPFFGYGLGSSLDLFKAFNHDYYGCLDVFYSHVHNEYLETMQESGIVGLCVLMLIAFWLFSKLSLTYHYTTDDNIRNTLVGIGIALLAYSALGVTSIVTRIFIVSLVVYIQIGVLFGCYRLVSYNTVKYTKYYIVFLTILLGISWYSLTNRLIVDYNNTIIIRSNYSIKQIYRR